MPSSPWMTFRAAVVLGCLVVVPLMAVFGASLPALLRTSRMTRATHSPRQLANHAVQGLMGDVDSPDDMTKGFELGAAGQGTSNSAAAAHGSPAGAMPTVSITHVRPIVTEPTGRLWAAAGQSPAERQAMAAPPPRSEADQPASRNPLRPTAYSPLRPTAYSQPHPLRDPEPSAQQWVPEAILECEERLRELGAVDYRLEAFGRQGELFRFHCRMTCGSPAGSTRHFEATDPDPTRAVLSVVHEVERWRLQR